MADQDSGHTYMQLFCSVGGADGVVVQWWWVGLLMMGRGIGGCRTGPGYVDIFSPEVSRTADRGPTPKPLESRGATWPAPTLKESPRRFPSSIDDNKVGNTLTDTSQRRPPPLPRTVSLKHNPLHSSHGEAPRYPNRQPTTGRSRRSGSAHGERMKIRCTKE